MNKSKHIYYLLAILLIYGSSTQTVMAQESYSNAYQEEGLRNAESVTLFSDRNIYTVNERIYFSTFYRKGQGSANEFWSKVLYVELISSMGNVIANGKFKQTEEGSSGYLLIPENTLSGNYILRSYTRWMRNYGPHSYSYVSVKIINPFNQQILSDVDNEIPEVEALYVGMDCDYIQSNTDRTYYTPGEDVQLEICNTASGYSSSGDYCLTVVRAGLVDTLHSGLKTEEEYGNGKFDFKYLPDIGGISISGSVLNSEDLTPAPNTRLYLSVLEENVNFFGVITDQQGRFILSLPDREGSQELLLVCEPIEEGHRKIRVDQDFTSDKIPFRTEPFVLSSNDRELVTQMTFNVQLAKAFALDKSSYNNESDVKTDSIYHFYGTPTHTVKLIDYVKLPTMNEVFVNIVPKVVVKYKKNAPYLYVETSRPNESLYQPLILVDQIPIFDQRYVFTIPPTKIERIDVISDVYIRGEMMYSGIIIISSKQGKNANVDIPTESYLFDYKTFSSVVPQAEFTATKRVPDVRNTQYWVDKFTVPSYEKTNMTFKASSESGQYNVLIRGVTSDGKVVAGKSTFWVE